MRLDVFAVHSEMPLVDGSWELRQARIFYFGNMGDSSDWVGIDLKMLQCSKMRRAFYASL